MIILFAKNNIIEIYRQAWRFENNKTKLIEMANRIWNDNDNLDLEDEFEKEELKKDVMSWYLRDNVSLSKVQHDALKEVEKVLELYIIDAFWNVEDEETGFGDVVLCFNKHITLDVDEVSFLLFVIFFSIF